MREMYCNLIRAKQAKALMLYFCNDDDKRLKAADYAVLRALAERMAAKTVKPKGRQTPTIANTCFPSLKSIARDAAMSESTASRAVDHLVAKGLITKEVIHNWKWKGRKDRAPRHNGVRYRVTSIWDEVPVVEYGEDFEERDEEFKETTEISAEDLAEVERVLADPIDLPIETEARASATVAKKQADEVFEYVKRYFAEHPTIANQSPKDARRSLNDACVDLARKALGYGDLNYADRFLWWLYNRRNEIYQKLMNGSIKHLGVHFGLPKTIADVWDEFVLERDDDYGQYDFEDGTDEAASEEPGIEDSALDFDETTKAPATNAPTTVFTLDDEDEAEPQEPMKSYIYERQAFVSELQTKTDLLRRPSDAFTITLDPEKEIRLGWVGRWLDAIPYGRQIVYERLGQSNKSILRVDIKWNVARYIVEHAEQFVKDGFVDEHFKPEIDPEVLAEIEAERVAAEEHARELERQRKEEAEAAEIQRQKDAEAAEAERKRKNFEVNCRRVLMRNTDADREAFEWIGGSADEVIRVQIFLQTNFAETVTITSASGTVLQAQVSGSLIAAWQSNEDGFLENGYVGTAADRESTPVAA